MTNHLQLLLNFVRCVGSKVEGIGKLSLLLASLLLSTSTILQAQCNFVGGLETTVSETYEAGNTGPYNTSIAALSPTLGAIVDVTGPAMVRICFWGDMGGNNETFNVRIAGQLAGNSGNFGFNPSAASPVCQDFIMANLGALEADLAADGDLDIRYNNFGAGWTPGAGSLSDNFRAQVVSSSFMYNIPTTITNPGDVCQDGTDIDFDGTPTTGSTAGDMAEFKIFPSTPAFNTTTGVLDVSAANTGIYNVVYEYTANGCTFSANNMVEIFESPTANLKDTEVACAAVGDMINLSVMFDGGNTTGGIFSQVISVDDPVASITGDILEVPVTGGCLTIRYEVMNPNGCSNAPYRDEASLYIGIEPTPSFTITGATSPTCSDGGNVAVTITNTSNGPGPMLTINGAAATFGANNFAAPGGVGSIQYTICLTETAAAGACPGLTPTACDAMVCQSFTVYNDGNQCGANAAFASECEPDFNATDVCNVEVMNNLALSCSFFTLNGPQLIEAELENPAPALMQCTDIEVCFDWQGSLPGNFGDIATGGPSIADINPVAGIVCDIITFEICIPLPIVDDFCLDPLPFPDFIEDACDQTIGQFIFSALGTLIGGDGGSGIVVADTDGDGNFDQIVEEYTFPDNGNTCVPNNITGESGTITIRNVVSWPFMASGACGTVSDESINLLELLPIGAIPLVGVIIEDLLAAASCNVELVFTDEQTIEIPVINRSPPEFANCNTAGYVFSEDGICDTEVNWSVPVAYDGCGGGILPYRGRTAGTDATNFNGAPPAVVVVMESGLYQTAGPIIGSDLDPGTYMVTYTAYSCASIESECTFPVVVSAGDPILACPMNTTVKTDVDVCTSVVTGIAPLQGMSCATVINYDITFAAASGLANATTATPYSLANRGTHNDASGLVFPIGTSTVVYTMMVDLNGDGDVSDTVDGTMETQTCNFTVTVIDSQKPVAACVDVDVQLDNMGNVTVFAENPNDGNAFVDGGSTDNCDTDLTIEIAKPNGTFGASVAYDCTETGYTLVTLRVTDDANNVSTCLAQIKIDDFFEGIDFDFDAPEICLEANNPAQLDFSNYLIITLPDATTIAHQGVAGNTYLGDAIGGFGISAFAPAIGSTLDPGSISTDGVYTPGTGSGFVTVSYVLALPGAVVQNNNVALTGCLEIVHTTFELRQPLEMASPECMCIVQNDRVVDLGIISGGLEPYTIQYGGVKLDVDSDGIADDMDGEYVYVAGTHDIGDFEQDLGQLLVDYTQPTWTITIVDARGCELFRSGSCDNPDEIGTPEIDCTALGAVTIYTRNESACEVQDTWTHTLPTDNCDVILYTYTIENPDGSIAGPFDLTALLNPDITIPLPDQFYGEYDFEHHSPTENVSTVTYYAEDAVGNFTQCSFTVTVIDDDPPFFINCPEPAVIVDAPLTWCAAYANYSLPLAEDNCGPVTVTQVDGTGLTSGSIFPVGITINTFEAVDETGNTIRCDVKIIVNDYHTPPAIECPENVVQQDNDPGDCGAIVKDIAPSGITDNCPDNLTIVYRIDDENGDELSSGFDDASSNFFNLGTSTVSYSVQDMPLLLITEVTHELSNTVDGASAVTPSCFDGIQNGDETGVDCGGSSCASCNCTDNEVTVEILLDNNPTQTAWAITEPNNGTVIAAGGPYVIGLAGTTVSESICLPDGCYDFVITDVNLDGICCAFGNGSYTVSTGTGILASGGDFGSREVTNFCLDGTPTASSLAGTAGTRDALEITNFGSANLDVSCLMIERIYAGGSETFAVPTGAILTPGGVLTIHFGDGHNDPANNVFFVPAAADLAIAEPAAYIISLSRSILDVLVLNNFDISGLAPPTYELGGLAVSDYWSGSIAPLYGAGVVRITVWDTNTSADFVPSEACLPITIGVLNPWLAQPTANGGHTAIQAQPTVRLECNFTVTITDEEEAVCGLYSDYNDYMGGPIVINFGECIETTISVADVYNIADVNLSLEGSAGDLGNLTITLISPEGTAIELVEAVCSGTDDINFTFDGDFGPPITDCAGLNAGDPFVPVGNIEAFNGEAVNGDWILQIGHNGQFDMSAASLSYNLSISARDPYPDYTVTLDNDPGLCGADYTWFHSILFDNCPGGTIQWTITFDNGTVDGLVEVNQPLPIFPENTEVTHFFQVGVSEVNYVLTDAAGNESSCGFTVTVLDVEFPLLTCPGDQVIQLGSGECETTDYPQIPVTFSDNCPDFVLSSFPPGTPVPIGDTIITLIITDASGNVSECTYNLTVLEHQRGQAMSCISELNVSLGADCEAEIIPEMVLTGDDHRCYDNYIITLYPELPGDGVDPIHSSPVIPLEFVGEQIVYEVCDPGTGECCWGYINVEYKLIPEFICPADTTILCTGTLHPDELGYPIVTSCVPGGAIITNEDEFIEENGTCGMPVFILKRTWTVADGQGNSATCVQTIEMAPFDLDQIVFPHNYDGIDQPVLECDEVSDDPTLTDPANLGAPSLGGGQSIGGSGYCSAALNYIDERFEICTNSFIIFRHWSVINLCLPNPISDRRLFTQVIKVEDLDGPDLICPAGETISVSPFDCTASYQIPILDWTDACSMVTYKVDVDGDSLVYNPTNNYLISGLEIGTHMISYRAKDECGKKSTCGFILIVEDQIEPTATCNDELNVSIGGGDTHNGVEGIARILASEVDAGSFDNCSDVTVEIRRNYFDRGPDFIDFTEDDTCIDNENRWSDWNEYVDFFCCDIGNEITVEMRVTDQSGNFNICWFVVTPEDKLIPYCYAPPSVDIDCNELPETFPGDLQLAYDDEPVATRAMMDLLFGYAWGTDNCAVDSVVERNPTINLNSCGWGAITRRFEIWQWRVDGDANGNGQFDRSEAWVSNNSCSQIIYVNEVHEYHIDFPEDASADCADPCIWDIITTTEGCDILAVNVGEPVRFAATGDECYKLSITYDVINWCLWDGEYVGYTIPRMTETDNQFALDRAVEGAERPILWGDDAGVLLDRDHDDRFPGNTLNPANDRRRPICPDGDTFLNPNLDRSDLADQYVTTGNLNRGRWNYTQFIKVYDTTVPVVTVDDFGGPTDLCPNLVAGQFGDPFGTCEADVHLTFSVADDCELLDNAGDLVISIISAELDAYVTDANGDGIIKANEFSADQTISITDNGDGTYEYWSTLPIITRAMGANVYHAIKVVLEDGCGNTTNEIIRIDVIDCKGPAPICINGLTVTLMPVDQTLADTDIDGDGDDDLCAMSVWANDFEGSPIYDCTGQGPETNGNLLRVHKYAIYRVDEVDDITTFEPDESHTGSIFTDDDLGDELINVYVFAFDQDGNYDYCQTYVQVEAHETCGDGGAGTIAGVIMTEAAETIAGVEVNLNGSSSVMTNSDGYFIFNNLELGDYSVTPFSDVNPLNGVTTFDIILISKHILGVQPLGNPYKMIAADVNASNSITTLDLIHIRKLILNITTEFPSELSWRFIESNFNFPNSLNPWISTFPEIISLNNLNGGALVANFLAVKLGDVNASANVNGLSIDERTTNEVFHLELDDVLLESGVLYAVPVYANDLNTIAGLQYTLSFDPSVIEVVKIDYALATENHFGLNSLKEGQITTSWNWPQGEMITIKTSDPLFSLMVRSKVDIQLSNTLSINQANGRSVVNAEAYPFVDGSYTQISNDIYGVDLQFNTSISSDGFELFQNIPNPLKDETLIGFYLPEADHIVLTIRDISGRVLRVIEDDLSAGFHRIKVTKQALNDITGVITYTLVSGKNTASRKMIIH